MVNRSPPKLAATVKSSSNARDVPLKPRYVDCEGAMLPGPPRRFSGAQSGMTVVKSPGLVTQTGLPVASSMLGPTALATRELRKDPPVVNVPAVRPSFSDASQYHPRNRP